MRFVWWSRAAHALIPSNAVVTVFSDAMNTCDSTLCRSVRCHMAGCRNRHRIGYRKHPRHRPMRPYGENLRNARAFRSPISRTTTANRRAGHGNEVRCWYSRTFVRSLTSECSRWWSTLRCFCRRGLGRLCRSIHCAKSSALHTNRFKHGSMFLNVSTFAFGFDLITSA